MTDPVVDVLKDDEWVERLFASKKPQAKEVRRFLTHKLLPVVMRGELYVDDGTYERLMGDLFIDCPELRPQPKKRETK
jgi:hypothetical protein